MPARHQGESRGQVEWPRSGLVSLEHKLLARKHWSLLCPAHMRLLGLKQSSADLGSSAGSIVRILAWLSRCDRVQSTHLVALLYTDCSWHSQGSKVAAGGRHGHSSRRAGVWDQPHVCPGGNWTEMPENREAVTPCGSHTILSSPRRSK